MSVALVDSLPQVGGQLAALYPEKYIYDMPGFPKILAKDLVNKMWEQALYAKPDLFLNSKVKVIKKISSNFEIQLENQPSIVSKTVILAVGIGAFTPKKLEVPGLLERENLCVHYRLKPLNYYSEQDVLIVGGGDSALDWSLAMAKSEDGGRPLAAQTSLIHRGVKFTAHEASVEELKRTSAKILMQTEIKEVQDVHDQGRSRTQVTLINNQTQVTQDIIVDSIIICTGYVAKMDFVKESGLALQGNSIPVSSTMETSIPGIFAIGDATTHAAKLKLIATGVGEAAIAANHAKVFIDPKAKAFPGHSTTKMEEKSLLP